MSFTPRPLEKSDYQKGFLDILAQLTTVGDVSEAQFAERFDELSSSGAYRIHVIEDTTTGRIIGTASLIVEKKFIHSCSQVGHIEDVVVDSTYRGQKLGQKLIESLISAARDLGCYKVILDCKDENCAFYEKCGLTRKEVQMVKYLDR